jgi:hypothetical protein
LCDTTVTTPMRYECCPEKAFARPTKKPILPSCIFGKDGLCCLVSVSFSYDRNLPVSTAVRTTAASVEAASACRVAVEPAAHRYMRRAAAYGAATNSSASHICGPGTVTDVTVTVPAITRAAPVSRPSIVTAVEPRACANEDSTGEVARAVVSVRRASVRGIWVVAVGANRSRANVPRPHTDAHHHTLCTNVRRQRQASAKYRKDHHVFNEVFHFWAPSEPVKPLY